MRSLSHSVVRELLVRDQSAGHESRTYRRASGDKYISDQTSRDDRQIRCPEWCGDANTKVRFGAQFNLHFHMPYLNSVYDEKGYF